VLVALLSGWANHEAPDRNQWAGIGLTFLGVGMYFWLLELPAGQGLGLAGGLFDTLVNALSTLYGRRVNAHCGLPPLAVTTTSMVGVSSLPLLAARLRCRVWGRSNRSSC
jgi:drug/metabolite transporter (DMT)-like permease